MSPEEIKALQDENARLTAEIAEKNVVIKQKDTLIEQKNQDIIGTRKKYQRLSELPPEEVSAMTEQEKKIKEDQDRIYDDMEAKKKQDEEIRQNERNSRINAAIKKVVGDNAELAKRVRENLDEIKNSDSAYTPEEIAGFVEKAANMLGSERPDPVQIAAMGAGGGDAPGESGKKDGDFANSDQGKSVGALLGLSYAREGGDGK